MHLGEKVDSHVFLSNKKNTQNVASLNRIGAMSVLNHVSLKTQRLKENATNEKSFTVFVKDVSHNINLMRIGKWRQLNRLSLRLNIPTQRFFVCLRAQP